MRHLYLFIITVLFISGLSGCTNTSSKTVSKADGWLAYNRMKPNVNATNSGLQYKVLVSSEEKSCKPTSNATVKVHYDMRLARSGKIVDSSFIRKSKSTFALNSTIEAWQEALPMMYVGDAWELYIPPRLAYGKEGMKGSVPGNSALISRIVLFESSNCD